MQQQPKTYAVQFTAAGLDYVRQVLGARPFDEVGQLVMSIEHQRAEQDKPAQPVAQPDPLPLPAATNVNGSGKPAKRRGRPPRVNAAAATPAAPQ